DPLVSFVARSNELQYRPRHTEVSMTARYVDGAGLDDLLNREWISVNYLGGYACSTEACFNTRKYHGLLVAAMSPPVRRMVLLSRAEERLVANTTESELACSKYPATNHPERFHV